MRFMVGARIFYEGDDWFPDLPPGYGWVVASNGGEVVIQWDCDGEETWYNPYGKAWNRLLPKLSIMCDKLSR
jgi:hypothetical protein